MSDLIFGFTVGLPLSICSKRIAVLVENSEGEELNNDNKCKQKNVWGSLTRGFVDLGRR